MSMMKRMLSLLLALALLMGNVPAVAFAEETEIPAETEMVAAEETLAPTEAETEPAASTEAVTEPAVEATVVPTEIATEPAVEETAAAVEISASETQCTTGDTPALAGEAYSIDEESAENAIIINPGETKELEIPGESLVNLLFTPAESGYYIFYTAEDNSFGWQGFFEGTSAATGTQIHPAQWSDSACTYRGNALYAEAGKTYCLEVDNSGTDVVNGFYTLVKAGNYETLELNCTSYTGYGNTDFSLFLTTGPDYAYETVTWTSSDPQVADIGNTYSNGVEIDLVAPGTAVITASTDCGSSASCTVTVTEPETILVDETKSFTLSGYEETRFLFTPTEAGRYVVYVPRNTCYHFVHEGTELDEYGSTQLSGISWEDPEGKYYGVAYDLTAGNSYVVQARMYGGTADCELTLIKAAPYETIKVQEPYQPKVGDEMTLWIDGTPSTASEKITWSTSDPEIAEIHLQDPYVILKLVAPGTVTITATADSGTYDTCTFTVQTVTELTADNAVDVTIEPDNYAYFTFTPAESGRYILYAPAAAGIGSNAEDEYHNRIYEEEWGNTDGAYSGHSYAFTAGVAYRINVYIRGEQTETVTTQLKLVKAVNFDTFTLSRESMNRFVGDYDRLDIVVTPDFASEAVTWKSSDPSVVSIVGGYAAYTYLESLAPGTATITATTATGKVATCVITVREPVRAEKNVEYTATVDVGHYIPIDFTAPESGVYTLAALGDGYYAVTAWDRDQNNVGPLHVIHKRGVRCESFEMKAGETFRYDLHNENEFETEFRFMIGHEMQATGMTMPFAEEEVYTNNHFMLKPFFDPILAIEESVTWESSDPEVVAYANTYHSPNEGGYDYYEFYTYKPGTVTLTATSENGLQASCVIHVVERKQLDLGKHTTKPLHSEDYTQGFHQVDEFVFIPEFTGEYSLYWEKDSVDESTFFYWNGAYSELDGTFWEDEKYSGIRVSLKGLDELEEPKKELETLEQEIAAMKEGSAKEKKKQELAIKQSEFEELTRNIYTSIAVHNATAEPTRIAFYLDAYTETVASGGEDQWAWRVDSAGRLTISGTGVMTDYAYKNFAPWYDYRSEIKSVVVEEGITYVGAHAFRDCTNLKKVVIADSVTGMGGSVFWNCAALAHVAFGSGLEKIPDGAFYKCSSLTSLEIPEGVTTIGANAFQACTSLRTIYIPATVTTVPTKENACAFHDCDESLVIYCAHEEAPASWGKWNGDMAVSYGYTRSEYDYWSKLNKSASSVHIAEGITRIPAKAFYGFANLVEVYIPDSVTVVGAYAFSGCNALKTVYIPAGVEKIAATDSKTEAAYDVSHSLNIYFGAAEESEEWDEPLTSTHYVTYHYGYSREDYSYWASLDKTKAKVIIPDGITRIPDKFFSGNTWLDDRAIPGENTTLESVTIPASVKTIGAYAFENCVSLTKVTLADGLEDIGQYAFSSCSSLKKISIPKTTISIDHYAFTECDALSIHYGGTMLQWMDVCKSNLPAVCSDGTITERGYAGADVQWMLDTKKKLTILGEGRMSVYDYYWDVPWYDYRGQITGVKVLDGVTSIANMAFYQCSKLKSVSLPETLIRIEEYAFSKCTALKSITIPRSVNYIGVEAFYNNKSLATITFRHGFNDDLTIDIGAFVTFSKTKKTTVKVPNKAEINPAIKDYDWSGDARKASYKSHYCDGNHSVISENAVEATCTQNGNTGKCYCEICGKILEENVVVKALGHNVEQWEITREAIYTVAGERQGNCERCGELVTEEIAALGLPKPVVNAAGNPVTGGGTLTWEHDGEADCYKIYRATSKKGKYKLLETVEGTEAEVKVSVGKTYYYKVKAICEADSNLNSGYSSVVKVTGKCAQPEITVEAGATGKPALKWGKVSGAKKYYIYRATEIDGEYEKVKSTTKTSYTDTKAKLGTEYFYKVKAIASKSSYNSIESAIRSCLTILAQPVVTAKNDAATGKPILSWKTVTGAVGYEIYCSVDEGEFTYITTQTELTYTDESAVVDGQYTYKVKAVAENGDLNSVDYEAETVTAACEMPSISIALDGKKPMVSWEAVEGATKYYVYRSTKKSSGYKKVATVEPEDGTSYRDSKAKKGTTYYYKIVAVSENAKSAYSNVVKIKSK